MDPASVGSVPTSLPDDFVGEHLTAADDGARLIALAAAAGEVLSASVEPEVAIRSLARLPVPDLADWSMVTILDDNGVLRDVDTWHRDPLRRPATVRFSEHRLDGIRDKSNGVTQAATSRQSVYVREGVAELAISRLESAEAIDAMRLLAPHSAAFVPLLHTGRLVGVLTLYRGPDRPPLSPAEETAVEIIGRRAAIALLNALEMRQHRDVSEELQRSMLTQPTSPDHLEIVAHYRPADESVQIGGDWYDAFDQQDGRTVLVIGDVVGHDITSAAAMGQLRNIIRGVAVATGAAPADLLTQVDRVMATLRMTTIATALVMRTEELSLQPPRVRLRWSNAGHPPPLVSDATGRVQQLDGHDLLLGVMADTAREEQSIDLDSGATVLMFTDGLVERRGESIADGLARLRQDVARLAGLPLDELIAGILPQHHEDDIAVLAVRFTPERRGDAPAGE